ncbi:MAG: type II toxin-antitoxin system RelE/ParE family toxin [Oceanicaulis sp.]
MRIRLSSRARSDFRQIYLAGAEAFGLRQADVYADKLEATIGRLAHFPELGRAWAGVEPSLRCLSHPPHVIVYRIGESALDVLRILHARQAPPELG